MTRESTVGALAEIGAAMGPVGKMCARSRCRHPWNDHLLHAATDNPFEGGTWSCPVEGCKCVGTWAVPQRPDLQP